MVGHYPNEHMPTCMEHVFPRGSWLSIVIDTFSFTYLSQIVFLWSFYVTFLRNSQDPWAYFTLLPLREMRRYIIEIRILAKSQLQEKEKGRERRFVKYGSVPVKSPWWIQCKRTNAVDAGARLALQRQPLPSSLAGRWMNVHKPLFGIAPLHHGAGPVNSDNLPHRGPASDCSRAQGVRGVI